MAGPADAVAHALIVALLMLTVTDVPNGGIFLVASGSAMLIELYWEVIRTDA